MAELHDLPRLSLAERDARWARVREMMRREELAAIVTPPHTGHWELFQADTRYLSHIGGNCSETACVFPLQGEVTGIVLNRPEFWNRAQEWVQDLRTPKRHMWSAPIIDRLRELGLERERIGVVGLGGGVRTPEGTIAHGIYQRLVDAFPSAEFVDATVLLANLRSVKSAEEIACMERSVEIIETGLHAVAAAARPGMLDNELYAELYYAMMKAGCEIPTMVLWATGPGTPRDAFIPTRRPIQAGDMVANEIEAKYLGYAAQRVQPLVLGDVPNSLVQAMEKQRVVFNTAMEHMKPGVPFGEVAALINAVANDLGCKAVLTMHGRGLGEDRPLLVGGDMTPETAGFILQEGNTFIMKPNVRLPDGPGITWGDTVAVTARGGKRLGKDPQEIVAIPC